VRNIIAQRAIHVKNKGFFHRKNLKIGHKETEFVEIPTRKCFFAHEND
jgi:hypothetical protein